MIRSLIEPIPREKKWLLRDRWRTLDSSIRRPGQGFGRQATGCGATIGAMPSCDFDCKGCYLGRDANQIPRLPLAQVLEQIDALREFLGPKGNLQITDGEVTLLPEGELLAMIQHARRVGLIPMLMTHGDTFRRKPGLLPKLVSEGGLTEVSIHVDSLQKGRRGKHGAATTETELMPLRDEMADMILKVRKRTGVRLRAATTLTVTRDNLPEIPEVVRWALSRRDAFGLISFQPLAQVGRTRGDQVGVTPDELWSAIAEALEPHGFDGSRRTPLQLGHPDCTRMEPFAVYQRRGEPAKVAAIVRAGSRPDEALVEGFFERGLGGINFRDDPILTRLARGAGLFLRAPGWFLGPALGWARSRARDLGTSLRGIILDVITCRVRIGSFLVVSHHFMDPAELKTEAGQARLDACVFRLPIGDEMVPMCQVNAGGLRDQLYEDSRRLASRPESLRSSESARLHLSNTAALAADAAETGLN